MDERAKRTGAYIELLGTYNPLTEPKDIKLKTDRIDYWIKQGAQFSTGYLRIIGKAPQRPPRKPKKENVEKNSENSENQTIGESEKPEDQTSETPVTSDTSGTPSPSESSEQNIPANKEEAADERPA